MLLAHLHLFEVALHPLAVFFEDFSCVVEAPLRPWDGSFYEPPCRFQEGAASRLNACLLYTSDAADE